MTTVSARADVCITIDEGRDTHPGGARSGADSAQQAIRIRRLPAVLNGCTESYVVSHLKFGDVTLSGPTGQRQAMGLSMNGVPALYGQLVRAILTGQDVGSMRTVVDRTNVIGTQAAPMRVQSDSLFFVRLGYGGVVGGTSHGGPAMGLGIRRELDIFAIDVSFFNVQGQSHYSYYSSDSGVDDRTGERTFW